MTSGENSIIAILLSEQAAALARREAARRAFIAADSDAIAIRTLLFDHGREVSSQDWLRAGERAAEAYGSTLMAQSTPDEVAKALQRWRAKLSQLSAAAA
ncbi:hypothetical protein [Bradyrhizobium japonicum]|uniref:hypothetical protein n=1 Tax=Bradyrhizobium japonicum TaxID=375 RepID=UPI00057D08F0|nr:hypothetical protein [Bradyrhizobium japonicum]MCD9110272.1 hypothetical protein [Bradyrhizobium japonicum]MCD9257451.1 hypothetical protein [Bradyrhizobium japonicum SEMIA 5079]MCD9823512.1 hypothetical protein [Bradyrhizobium japonicum]MCD9895115.1 hypothetical protein [Bradyrhizobium japonicum]MCD9910721.1 hypothetical protein [Bradyrhizobium japonicum]